MKQPPNNNINNDDDNNHNHNHNSTNNNNKFERGEHVEVCGKRHAGLQGSYYLASVISCVGEGHYIVQYPTLIGNDETRLLREIVAEADLRPLPPPAPPEGDPNPRTGDEVDAMDNGGWWHGTVVRRWRHHYEPAPPQLPATPKPKPNWKKFQVTFKSNEEQKIYSSRDIRLHLDWVDGKWVRPKNANEDRPPKRHKPKPTRCLNP